MRIKMLREFIASETMAGFCLFLAAVLAIIVDNSPWAHYYHDILHDVWTLHLHVVVLSKSLHHWVNDGLMSIFFLLGISHQTIFSSIALKFFIVQFTLFSHLSIKF